MKFTSQIPHTNLNLKENMGIRMRQINNMAIHKPRVVLLDADERFLLILKTILLNEPNIRLVNSHHDKPEFLKSLKKDHADIVIADLDYWKDEKVDLIRSLKKYNHNLNVLLLTDDYEQEKLMDAISAGPAGLLKKSTCISHIIESVQTLCAGGSPIDPFFSRVILNSLQVEEQSILTEQERKILRLLSQGCSSVVIALELSISRHTARTHLKNIYKKLNVTSKYEALQKAEAERLIPAFR